MYQKTIFLNEGLKDFIEKAKTKKEISAKMTDDAMNKYLTFSDKQKELLLTTKEYGSYKSNDPELKKIVDKNNDLRQIPFLTKENTYVLVFKPDYSKYGFLTKANLNSRALKIHWI